MSQSEPHDEFLELCAASTTGDLTADEQKRLDEHLAVCPACREACRQYQSIVDHVIPAIAAQESSASEPTSPREKPDEDSNGENKKDGGKTQARNQGTIQGRTSDGKQKLTETSPPDFLRSLKQAQNEFRDRLHQAEDRKSEPASRFDPSSHFPFRGLPSSASAWRNVWMLYAAGILLFASFGIFFYRIGLPRNVEITTGPPPSQPAPQKTDATQASLEEQLSDAGHERALAKAELDRREQIIAGLRQQLKQQASDIASLRAAQNQLEANLREGDASRQSLVQEKDDLARKLEAAENNSRQLQASLDSFSRQASQEAIRARASDARIQDLTRQVEEQQARVAQRDELLSHDRDIRELMGARDLYIAEIYDVAGNGETKKPYGRVFYTRGKSLIFYAYDLDQQTEVKRAATFQVWGRRGPDRQQAVKLGVFYEDNATKDRWLMKCDDPKTLAQIDAVFVTIEPKEGSNKPSKKTLLFASLKVDPNHP